MSENGIAVVSLNGKEYECSIELAEAFVDKLESVKAEWRRLITDFTKDCKTTPIAVMGEMTPDVGRIFLEQAKHEWTKQARAEEQGRARNIIALVLNSTDIDPDSRSGKMLRELLPEGHVLK